MTPATASAKTQNTKAKTKDKTGPIFSRTPGLTDAITNYCPGCTHGIVQRLVAEAIEELDAQGRAVGVCPVGCSVLAYEFYSCDMVQAAHGRAPAVATGLKRARPENVIFTYQGDGDLASIGMAETVHAATRGENITVIFINNAIYGMTGGQMAPTSLPGQVTQTSPYGRDVETAGYPIRVCEMLSSLDGVALAQRVTVDSPRTVRAAKKAIKKAFEYQTEGLGYTIIEVVATCPTNWGFTPADAFTWLRDNLLPYYPLGVYRDIKAESKDDKAADTVADKLAAAKAAKAEASTGSTEAGSTAPEAPEVAPETAAETDSEVAPETAPEVAPETTSEKGGE